MTLANNFYSLEPNGEHFNKLVGPEISMADGWRASLRKAGWADLMLDEDLLPQDPHEPVLFLSGSYEEQMLHLGYFDGESWTHQNEPFGRIEVRGVIAWRGTLLPSPGSVRDGSLRLIAGLWFGEPVSKGCISSLSET